MSFVYYGPRIFGIPIILIKFPVRHGAQALLLLLFICCLFHLLQEEIDSHSYKRLQIIDLRKLRLSLVMEGLVSYLKNKFD